MSNQHRNLLIWRDYKIKISSIKSKCIRYTYENLVKKYIIIRVIHLLKLNKCEHFYKEIKNPKGVQYNFLSSNSESKKKEFRGDILLRFLKNLNLKKNAALRAL